MAAARYVGRFAPSPTGPLHVGSLLTAVASFLHARQHGGRWLVRIENIDPPREQPGATDAILRTLDAFELHWDGPAVRQIDRRAAYRDAAEQLVAAGKAFRCNCSRRQILEASGTGRYPGTCRDLNIQDRASTIRVHAPAAPIEFEDELQGRVAHDIRTIDGDYLIFRRDDLPAYHLAVVLDDAATGVTDVVRGVDLLHQTAIHIDLQHQLGLPQPRYWHMPVVTDESGEKLSKQSGARGVGPSEAARVAVNLLALLGLRVPAELIGGRPAALWRWAEEEWSIDRHRGQRSIRLAG